MKINKKIKTIILKRLSVTLFILLFVRMGTFLPIPGINPSDLEFYIQSHSVTKSLVSTFSGNNTFVIGLFTLNKNRIPIFSSNYSLVLAASLTYGQSVCLYLAKSNGFKN